MTTGEEIRRMLARALRLLPEATEEAEDAQGRVSAGFVAQIDSLEKAHQRRLFGKR